MDLRGNDGKKNARDRKKSRKEEKAAHGEKSTALII